MTKHFWIIAIVIALAASIGCQQEPVKEEYIEQKKNLNIELDEAINAIEDRMQDLQGQEESEELLAEKKEDLQRIKDALLLRQAQIDTVAAQTWGSFMVETREVIRTTRMVLDTMRIGTIKVLEDPEEEE